MRTMHFLLATASVLIVAGAVAYPAAALTIGGISVGSNGNGGTSVSVGAGG